MTNQPDTYYDCGAKAARAHNHTDIGMFQFQNNWFNRAMRLENDDDKAAARKSFNAGYDSERAYSMVSAF